MYSLDKIDTVVAAFVGYAPNMDLPFQVGTNHGTAMQRLREDMFFYGFLPSGISTWFGFIVKDAEGNYRYAYRKESYSVAKEAGQLNDRKGSPDRLDSYQISNYDDNTLSDLEYLAMQVNEKFRKAYFEPQTAPLDNR